MCITVDVIYILINDPQICECCFTDDHSTNECTIYNNSKNTTNNYHSFESDDPKNGWECSYCNKEFDTLKGAKFHENVYCKKKKSLKNTKKKYSSTCYRCGRKNHFSKDCYATKHIKGYYLS